MSDERFSLDTNILVYSVDLSSGHRLALARAIIRAAFNRGCWLALQALSEFYVVATRKGFVDRAAAATQVEDWFTAFPTVAHTPETVRFAIAASRRGEASFWDAQLISTVAQVGCTVLLSEDMADGVVIHGVRIINPFAETGLSAAAGALLMR